MSLQGLPLKAAYKFHFRQRIDADMPHPDAFALTAREMLTCIDCGHVIPGTPRLLGHGASCESCYESWKGETMRSNSEANAAAIQVLS